MDCAEEIAALRREVGPLVGGEDRLSFDLLGGQMVVAANAGVVPDAVIVAAAGRAGLQATPIDAGTAADPGWRRRHGRLVATVASGCGTGAGGGDSLPAPSARVLRGTRGKTTAIAAG